MHKLPRFVLLFLILFVAGLASAQSTEVGIVVGGIISPQSRPPGGAICIRNFPNPNCNANVNTETTVAVEGVIAHRLLNFHLASIYAELPIVGIPDRTAKQGTFSQDFSSLYFTPSLKLKFSAPGLSPWVSVGGGFAHFSANNVAGAIAASSTRNALQVGAGVDFSTPIPFIGFRAEVREFYTGRADLFVTSPPQHNVLVGGGLVFRF
jgi:hypothetical protein